MDKVGKQTLEIMKHAGWYNRWLFGFMKDYVFGEILEVGAGLGSFTKFFLDLGEVTAIDYEKTYLEKLRKVSSGSKKAKVGWGDIEKGKYFFKDKTFDSVICMNVLEHINDDLKALQNIRKLLRKGGNLVILVPAYQFLFGSLDTNLGHYRRYSKTDLVLKLKKTGFEILVIKKLNFLGFWGWLINSRILKRKVIPLPQLLFFDKISRPLLIIEKFMEAPLGLSLFVVAKKI